MKRAVWIGGGNVVLPREIRENCSVLIEGGRIAAIGEACPPGAERVDAAGCYVLPGFIDIHVHGGGGADFMDAEPDSAAVIAQAHCRHGTTALAATTMTCPDERLEEVIRCFLEARKKPTGGAELLGLHLEGPYFSAAGRGAQPVTEQRIPERSALERILSVGQGHILRWDEAPELPNTDVFAQVMSEHGVLAAVAHTQANATQAMAAFDAGFSHVTHFYNATSTFHKEQGLVHAGVIEATYLRDDVTIELIGDGRHIPRESMRLAHRIKGADKICLITDAMRAADTKEERSILGGKTDGTPVVIRDRVAQLPDFSSYAGSVCTMDRALRVAHLEYGLPLTDVVRMLSLTPARLCGCSRKKGSIARGKDADLVVMDSRFEVRAVYVRGEKRV